MATAPLNNLQAVALAKQVVALAADHLSLRLAGLGLKRRLLLANPAQARDDGEANVVVGEVLGGRDPHLAIGGVDTQVQIFDVFAHHLHRDVANDYGGRLGGWI